MSRSLRLGGAFSELDDDDYFYRYGPRSRRRESLLVKGFIWISILTAMTGLITLFVKDHLGISPSGASKNQSPLSSAREAQPHHHTLLKAFRASPKVQSLAEEGRTSGITGIIATNEYSESAPVDVGAYPWDLLVEPYRDTTLTLEVTIDIDLKASNTVATWVITGPSTSFFSTFKGTGASIVVQFKGVGYYTIEVSLTATTADGDPTAYSYSMQAMNKYVRREIRTLTDEDREVFLDALHTVYTVSTEEGQALYGEGYRDIAWYVKKHLYGAADRECDHWHDDAGIVNHHVAYTLEMEQNLQLIDPAITIPYWEYTIDAFLDSWEDSILFDDDWFGEASPTNDDHIITTGRWAYTPIKANASGYSRAYNPYGLLRSPWNTNPTPYFTRNHYMFGTDSFFWPTCEEFSECYNSTSFSDISLCLNGYTHGPVHIKIGGEWGMDEANYAVAMKYEFVVPYLLLVKNLWRHGIVTCPTDCTNLSPDEDCRCGLTEGVLDQLSAYQILTKYTGIMSNLEGTLIYWDVPSKTYRIQGVDKEEDLTAYWEEILNALSDPYYAGEMYTSAAPYDPTFWVIHPTAERLLNARRIYDAGSFDETWGYDHSIKAASDDGQVCIWNGVDEENDLPTCIKMICDGHHEYDVIPFSKFKADQSDIVYTNKEFLAFIHPFNDDVPYLYDNFQWTQCESSYPIVTDQVAVEGAVGGGEGGGLQGKEEEGSSSGASSSGGGSRRKKSMKAGKGGGGMSRKSAMEAKGKRRSRQQQQQQQQQQGR